MEGGSWGPNCFVGILMVFKARPIRSMCLPKDLADTSHQQQNDGPAKICTLYVYVIEVKV